MTKWLQEERQRNIQVKEKLADVVVEVIMENLDKNKAILVLEIRIENLERNIKNMQLDVDSLKETVDFLRKQLSTIDSHGRNIIVG